MALPVFQQLDAGSGVVKSYPTTDQPVQADELPFQLNFTNNIAQWSLTAPANEVLSKIHGMFGLPAFSVQSSMNEGVPPTPVIIQAPYIVAQWNFTASGWFTITGYPTFPANPNYVLTIRYIKGGVVYRYKIFGYYDDGVHCPIYTGQPIGINFSLEVWNYVTAWSQVVSQVDNSVQFQTSRTQIRQYATNATSYMESAGTQVATMFATSQVVRELYQFPVTFGADACGVSN